MAALTDKQVKYLGAAAVVGVFVLYVLGRKAVEAAVDTGKGIVTGDNALTKGTAYEGAGVAGSIGAAADAASGGVLSDLGSKIGIGLYDWLHPDEANIREQQSQGIGEP